jgi:hypothetical protein
MKAIKAVSNFIKYLIKRIKKLDNKTKVVYIALMVLILLFPTITLSRYIYNIIKDRYYLSQNFYFNSELLSSYTGNLDNVNHNSIKNNFSYSWDGSSSGVDNTIILYSTKQGNSLKTSDADIDYNFDFCIVDDNYKCITANDGKETDSIVVSLVKENPSDVITSASYSRTIAKANNSDSFKIHIAKKASSPVVFNDGDRITIRVWAQSTSPYVEKLAGYITYIIKKIDVSYEISDKEYDLYATLRLSNSRDSGDSEKANITFDPRYVRLDMSNQYYLDCLNDSSCNVIYGDYYKLNENVTVGGTTYKKESVFTAEDLSTYGIDTNKCTLYNYVKGFSVDIEPLYSVSITFYKDDVRANYTYNGLGDDSSLPIHVEFINS